MKNVRLSKTSKIGFVIGKKQMLIIVLWIHFVVNFAQ